LDSNTSLCTDEMCGGNGLETTSKFIHICVDQLPHIVLLNQSSWISTKKWTIKWFLFFLVSLFDFRLEDGMGFSVSVRDRCFNLFIYLKHGTCIRLWNESSTVGAVSIAQTESEIIGPGHSVHAGNSKIHLYSKAACTYSRSFKVQRFWWMLINKSSDTLTCTTLARQESIW